MLLMKKCNKMVLWFAVIFIALFPSVIQAQVKVDNGSNLIVGQGAHLVTSGGLSITVESGGSMSIFGTGSAEVDGDVRNSGTLTLGTSSVLSLAGDWINSGTFNAGTGTVTLSGTGQQISGSSDFYNLTKIVTSADTLIFINGSANKTTITNTLTLQGSSGELLSLRSDVAGSQWEIDPQGTRILSYLDVKDSNNINSGEIDVAGLSCANAGNNTSWIFTDPVVTTQAVADISITSATGNGNVATIGDPAPTQHGVCWATGENPTTSDNKTEEGVVSSTGAFTSNITGLSESTTYHVRAYVTGSAGTFYGDDVSFTTLATLTGAATVSGTAAYGETLTASLADGNNTGILSYQWTRGGSNISGATNETYVLTADDVGNTIAVKISSSVETGTITSASTSAVVKADQTISSFLPANGSKYYNTDTAALSAAASSGLEVSFTVTSGPGAIEGSTLSFTGTGTVIITADQTGDSNYNAASTVTHSISVYTAVSIDQAGPLTVTMSEDRSPTAWSSPTVTASNGQGTLTWSLESGPSNGTASVSGTGISGPQVFSYSPDADYNGTDSFVIKVSDEENTSDTITVNVTVESVNDAPVIGEDDPARVAMSADSSPVAFSLSLSATDTENDTLTWSLDSAAEHGTAAVSGTGGSPSTLTYTPDIDYAGSDSFVVAVSDGNGGTDTATVQVTVIPPIAAETAIQFDGTDDYVAFTSSPAYSDTAAITIEAWVKPTSTAGLNGILCWGNDGSEGSNVQFRIYDGKLQFGSNDDGWQSIESTANISSGEWTHVAVAKNGTASVQLYVNGVADANGANTNDSNDVPNMYIGAYKNLNTNEFEGFSGKIDEVRIWNDVRTAEEIRANMHHYLAGTEEGLAAYYPMGAVSGTTLTDYTANDNNGTLYDGESEGNGPTWKTSGAFMGPRNAIKFDGADDQVTATLTEGLLSDQVTQEVWVRFDDLSSQQNFTYLKSGASNTRIVLFKNTDNSLCVYLSENDTDIEVFDSGYTVEAGHWYHIAVVYDQAKVYFYVDGRLISQNLNTVNIEYSGALPLVLGSDSGGFYSYTTMDEVRIWNTVRTAAEIRETMNMSLAGDETGLVAYYRFDQEDGTTVYDWSENGNNGTMVNMDAATDWVASAAFNTWVGADSADWATASNWSLGTVPAAADNIGLYEWVLGYATDITGTPTVNSMVVGSSAMPDLSSGITVNGSLILENDVYLNGQTVTLGTDALLIEDEGLFYGTTGEITTTRELSNIDENVAGIGVTITSIANLGETTITRKHAAFSINSSSITRSYEITPANNTGLNAALVFSYDELELLENNESSLALFRSADSGTTWTDMGGTLDSSSNTLTLTGLDGFSMWTAGTERTDQTITDFLPADSAEFEADDTPTLSALASSGLAAVFAVASGPATLDGVTLSFTGTGTVVITADQPGDTVYNPASTVSHTLTVTKAALTVIGASAQDKTYDSSTSGTITGGTLFGVADGDTVTLENSSGGTFAQSDVGTDISVATVMTLGGADADKYILVQPTLKADITAKGLTVSGAAAQNKTYDGTTAAVISGATLSGVIDGDDVSFDDAASGTFATADAGSGIVVTGALTITGVDAGNYTLYQPTLSADITKAPCTTATGITPVLSDSTPTSITLTSVSGYEYMLVADGAGSTGSWQDSNTFSSLTENTLYDAYQRVKATSNYLASGTSDKLDVTTDPGILTGTAAISGTVTYGETLTASLTGGNNTGTLSYQWIRSGSDISGATNETYVLTADDVGNTIAVKISSSVETGAITSASTAAVSKAACETATGITPVLSGAAPSSITLASVSGYEYMLVTDGAGATGSWQDSNVFTGLTVNTPYDAYQRVKETSTHLASGTSGKLDVTTDPNVLTGTGTISGTAVYGETLTASLTGSNNTGTLSYQWTRGGSNISGATSETYVLAADDVGNTIAVKITSSVETGTVTSANTSVVAKADQTIINFLPANGSSFVSSDTVTLSATASSDLTVTFNIQSGPGSITGGTTLSFTGAGTVLVTADQTGNSVYNQAPTVTRSYNVESLGIPTATDASSVTATGFTANWNSLSGATGYLLDVATDSSFEYLVSGYNNLDVGNTTNCVLSGLETELTYYYRVRAYNASGIISAVSNVINTYIGAVDYRLSDLTAGSGTLSPVFTSDTLEYYVLLDSAPGSFSFTPTVSDSSAYIFINNIFHTSGTAYTDNSPDNLTTHYIIDLRDSDNPATSVTKRTYHLYVSVEQTTIPGPAGTWIDSLVGENYDPNDDQQATAATDLVGDATYPMVQAQQNVINISGTAEKVYYFRARLGNTLTPKTSGYFGLDVDMDQRVDMMVEANIKATSPYVAYHIIDPTLDGSGPSKTSWLNSTKNDDVEKQLSDTDSYIVASSAETDLDTPVGGQNNGTDTWLIFGFTESSFSSWTGSALNSQTDGDDVVSIVFMTSTSQKANGDIGGIDDNISDMDKSWAELGISDTGSFEGNTASDPDPPTVSINSVKSLNGSATVYGLWNGDSFDSPSLLVTVGENTYTYPGSSEISLNGENWVLSLSGYAAGSYSISVSLYDGLGHVGTDEATLLVSGLKIDDLITRDTMPVITGTSTDTGGGHTVTINIYSASDMVTPVISGVTAVTEVGGDWTCTVATDLSVGSYKVSGSLTVDSSISQDVADLEVLANIIYPAIEIDQSNLVVSGDSMTITGTSNYQDCSSPTMNVTVTGPNIPTVGDLTINGDGTWSRELSGLVFGTYVITAGLSAGDYDSEDVKELSSSGLPPTVVTGSTADISSNAATANGNVTNSGGSAVTNRGIKYDTSSGFNPATSGTAAAATEGGSGLFSVFMTGLTEGTTYYVYAYATNSAGTSYGDVESFTTLSVLTGTANISGTAAYGETLTASLSDGNNSGTLSYQWTRGGSDISGATNSTYTLTMDDIGYVIAVRITSSVETGSVTSVSTSAVTKAACETATGITPVLSDAAPASITLTAVSGYEYMLVVDGSGATGTWQDSNTFTGLLINTSYDAYQRVKESATHLASGISAKLDVTTDPKGLTVSGATVNNKTYDGTTVATISGATLVGVVDGDTVILENAASGTFAQADAGTDISVTAAMILGGPDALKYSLTQPTLSADITAETLTVTAKDMQKVYGAEMTFTGLEFETSGLVDGDSVTSVTLTSTGTAAGASTGTYSIVPSAAQGSGLTNYDITYVNGILTVSDTYHYKIGQTGEWDWSTAGNWLVSATGSDPWVVATVAPDSSNSESITIEDGAIVNVDSDLAVNRMNIAEGAAVVVTENNTLTVKDGSGTDLSVPGSLTISNGTVNIEGTIDATDGEILFNEAGNLNLAGDVVSLGNLIPGDGTVAYTVEGPQTVIGADYNNLILSGSGTKILGDEISVFGDLEIGSDVTLDVSDNNYGIYAGGDWINNGTFNSRSGAVILDGEDQIIAGNTSFYDLTKSVTSAATLIFEAESVTTITGTLTLEGQSEDILILRSSVEGTQWDIDPQSEIIVAYLDIQDLNNINGTEILIGGTGSIDSGNNTGLNFYLSYSVSTLPARDIGDTSASVGGSISFLGQIEADSHGVCWSISPAPTIVDGVADLGSVAGTGAFVTTVTDLDPETLYYIRAYVTSSDGTTYGSELTFETLSSLDTDNDGIPDYRDGDNNNNGVPDYKEEDSDEDGISDFLDEDDDNDGTPDYQDEDDDNDGIADSEEGIVDSDSDGIPDSYDEDDDNDGIPDEMEEDIDGDKIPNYQDEDDDNDKILDEQDEDDDNNGIDDYLEKDSDGDGVADYLDEDDDNDGISDDLDEDDDNDGIADDEELTIDTDKDGIPDYQDEDDDNDGIPDYMDEDADGDGIPDRLEEDSDGDGIVNYLDDDDDGDGITDEQDDDDDNNGIPDYLEGDSDGDGVADYQDQDDDNDGIMDYEDDDDDNDGIADDEEQTIDTDDDGVPDYQDEDDDNDIIPDYMDEDADGDGIPDKLEKDTDGDGVANYLDDDDDNDGISDEFDEDDDNNGIADYLEEDSDGDGVANYLDDDDDNDGIADDQDDDDNNNGVSDDEELTIDTDYDQIPNYQDEDDDNDEIPDYLDDDDDGDGLPDRLEGDSDSDGIPDYQDEDDNNDGISDDLEGDSDDDGIADYLDDDDDNDGIPDDQDDDDDNDGIADDQEKIIDTDDDGIPNYQDWDDDNDRIPDSLDEDNDNDGISDSEEGIGDTDSDGFPDYLDMESDGDGVDDEIENGAANNGDGNNDGISDRRQCNVTSILTYDESDYVTLESPEGTSLTDVWTTENPSPEDMPSDASLLYGSFEFNIENIGERATVDLTIYLPDDARPVSYIKYGPTPDDASYHWYEFMYDGTTGAEIDGNIITLHFVDGERGDDVMTQDGLVVDIGAPVFASEDENSGSVDSDSFGPAGGSGCFINTVRPKDGFPCRTAAMLILTAIMSALFFQKSIRKILSRIIIVVMVLCIMIGAPADSLADGEKAFTSDTLFPDYVSLGLGYAFIDSGMDAGYSGRNYHLEVNSSLYPVLRCGYSLTEKLAVEAGLRWDIFSGSMDRAGAGGASNLQGFTVLLGPVFTGETRQIEYFGPVKPTVSFQLGYVKILDDIDFPANRFDSALRAEVAVGVRRDYIDLRWGYRFVKLDLDGVISGVTPSDSSDELDLSGVFFEIAYLR